MAPSLLPEAPDISESLPAYLPSSILSSYGPTADYDVTIGDVGFNLRPSQGMPFKRGTEPMRKQQLDTSNEPGEQSLGSWWFRSQDSWDMGAGIKWYEPGTDEGTTNRFATSQGVNIWTRGQISLLDEMEVKSAEEDEIVYLSGLLVDGVRGYVRAWDDQIEWIPETGTPVLGTIAGTACTQPSAAGGIVYVGYVDGVGKWDPDTNTFTELYTHAGSDSARVWWAKSRLIVAVDNDLYECAPVAGTTVVADGKRIAHHPDPAWVWSDVAEVGGAILASGHVANDSGIYRFTVEQDETGIPTILEDSGSQVVHMPPGEAIKCLSVYLAAYVILGTSEGIRVGVSDDAGSVVYGPLTVELTEGAEPVDITFRDRFAYVAVTNGLPDGTSGAVRIDLSAEIDSSGRYAWAWDVSSGVEGPCDALALVNEGVYISVDGSVYGPTGNPLESGYLETGKIRYGTVEPKAFRYMRLISILHGGTIQVTAIAASGAEYSVVNFDPTYLTSGNVGINIPGPSTVQHLAFRIYLNRSPENTSPVVNGFVIKAVPAAERVRIYQYPLMCFDFESNRWGNQSGTEGGAWARLNMLDQLEDTSVPVQVIDNRTGEAFVGQIDGVEFTSTSPPDGASSGFGGMAYVTIRKI